MKQLGVQATRHPDGIAGIDLALGDKSFTIVFKTETQDLAEMMMQSVEAAIDGGGLLLGNLFIPTGNYEIEEPNQENENG